MPPRRRNRAPTPLVDLPPGNPDDEEVFSIHSVDDSSASPPSTEVIRSSARLRSRAGSALKTTTPKYSVTKAQPRTTRQTRGGRKTSDVEQSIQAPVDVALTISDDSKSTVGSSVVEDEDEGLLLEDVHPSTSTDFTSDKEHQDQLPIENKPYREDDEDEDLELEDVDVAQGNGAIEEDHSHAYAAAYQAAEAETAGEDGDPDRPAIYYDGKGQAGGISIEVSSPKKANSLANTKKRGPVVTPRDRQIRLATHKLVVLSVIAHIRNRNRLINDDRLRDDLYGMVPNAFLEKLRMIHPKKVPVQNERVRQFEIFLRDLTRWWSHKFTLDPVMTTCGALRQPDADILAGVFPRIGKRVDGWVVESSREREERKRTERRAMQVLRELVTKEQESETAGFRRSSARKNKGKAKQQHAEEVEQAKATLKNRHPLGDITLFGIGDSTTPVYLRLSEKAEIVRSVNDLASCVQHMSGSREVSAQLFTSLCRALGIPARLVVSIQTPSWSVGAAKVASSTGAAPATSGGDLAKRKRAHEAEVGRQKRLRIVRKPESVMTSDDESFLGGTLSDNSVERIIAPPHRKHASAKASSNTMSASNSVNGASSPASAAATPTEKGHKKEKDADYRDEKWRNLDKPLEVKFVPKLRVQKPKALKETELVDAEADADPVDTSTPPTVWVEVFSKPWQKWITVDPIRGMVEPLSNRHMEPSSSDRSNRLVYVLAFEEDNYARDVTARYTRTLHSRVSRMRPPAMKKDADDWWSRVVAAVHRPENLDRDAAEDAELEQASSREPMPSSVAAFKDHPVYALEKHVKRDEVIFPAKQAGTFQGMPVFLRSNVIACKSARQWYNEGRVVKDGEEALKWVKSRGYTLANKRAEEEARQQGFDGLQEGLYANFQTDVYCPPAVVDGKIPTNSFGNIDLFVDTMLPAGAVHIPYNGVGKVAKQLGVQYAEAIVGFEFRKHRSMPKLKGIVVAEEYGDMVMDAYWAAEQISAEKERKKKRERQIKEWKKKLSAAQIRQRIRREYGHLDGADVGSDEDDHEFSDRDQDDESSDEEVDTSEEGEPEEGEQEDENLEAYRNAGQDDGQSVEEEDGGGGFLID